MKTQLRFCNARGRLLYYTQNNEHVYVNFFSSPSVFSLKRHLSGVLILYDFFLSVNKKSCVWIV